MLKKIALLLTLVLYVHNCAFASDSYVKKVYLKAMEKKIAYNWIKPVDNKGKSAVVSFVVNRDGTFSNIVLLRSSQNDVFDDSAMTAVFKAYNGGDLPDNEDQLFVKYFFSPVFTSMTVSDSPYKGIVNVASKTPYIDYKSYADNLEQKINTNWAPKKSYKKRYAIVSVDINKEGSLDDIRMVKPSGSRNFDRTIYDSILTSVPLQAFPKNMDSDYKSVEMVFVSNSSRDKKGPEHYINAGISNINGYDDYVKDVEKILADALKHKTGLFSKDMLLELSINKIGGLKYVKVVKHSNNKNFDRRILSLLYQTSFPPIPDSMNLDSITFNYLIFHKKGAFYAFPEY